MEGEVEGLFRGTGGSGADAAGDGGHYSQEGGTDDDWRERNHRRYHYVRSTADAVYVVRQFLPDAKEAAEACQGLLDALERRVYDGVGGAGYVRTSVRGQGGGEGEDNAESAECLMSDAYLWTMGAWQRFAAAAADSNVDDVMDAAQAARNADSVLERMEERWYRRRHRRRRNDADVVVRPSVAHYRPVLYAYTAPVRAAAANSAAGEGKEEVWDRHHRRQDLGLDLLVPLVERAEEVLLRMDDMNFGSGEGGGRAYGDDGSTREGSGGGSGSGSGSGGAARVLHDERRPVVAGPSTSSRPYDPDFHHFRSAAPYREWVHGRRIEARFDALRNFILGTDGSAATATTADDAPSSSFAPENNDDDHHDVDGAADRADYVIQLVCHPNFEQHDRTVAYYRRIVPDHDDEESGSISFEESSTLPEGYRRVHAAYKNYRTGTDCGHPRGLFYELNLYAKVGGDRGAAGKKIAHFYTRIISAWSQLQLLIGSNDHVSTAAKTTMQGRGGGDLDPAQRAESVLKLLQRRCAQGLVRLYDNQELTYAYNQVLVAWSKSGAGAKGAARAATLFDAMTGGGSIDHGRDGGRGRDGRRAVNVIARPDEFTYGVVLAALSKSGTLRAADRACSILSDMEAAHAHYWDEGDGVPSAPSDAPRPTARHYSYVTTALSRSGGGTDAAKKAQALLDSLLAKYEDSGREDADLMPDAFLFSSVLSAWTRSKDGEAGKRALELLLALEGLYHDTEDERLKPDVAFYGSVLDALATGRDKESVDAVESLLSEMEAESREEGDASLMPNKVCYTAAVLACGRNGLPERAEAFIEKMDGLYQQTGDPSVRPDTHVFSAVIDAWSKKGTAEGVERSFALLKEMQQRAADGDRGVKPNYVTFTNVMNALWRSGIDGAGDEAEEILTMMEDMYADGDTDARPTVYAYTSAINTWGRSNAPNKATRAQELLRRMDAQYRSGNLDARPNMISYTAVLNACAHTKGSENDKAEALRIALEVLSELQKVRDERPSNIVFRTLLQAYGNLVADRKERAKLATITFKLACEEGQVDKSILGTLKRVAPSVFYKIGRNSGGVNLEDLPPEWSQNVRR